MDEFEKKPKEGGLLAAVAEEAPAGSARAESAEESTKAEECATLLEDIFDIMDFDVDVDVREEDEEQIVLDVTGPDAGRVIGKKGQTLEALQFLLNKIMNRTPEEHRYIVVDSGDYRERHEKGLVTLAKREAKRAKTEGRTVTLHPMSPRDRRVIHLSLAKLEGVKTESKGHGSQRRIQIIPHRS